jgi:hypothetical protein
MNEAGNCTIDAAMQWPTMTAYFFHSPFVGYGTGSLLALPQDRKIPNATTVSGLRIGDTLARARVLYGNDLTTSYAQGGSWFAASSSGRLAGLLTAEINHSGPTPRIADITAGSVGCPAVSP